MSLLGLVVHHAFAGYSTGQIITDADQMAKASAEYPAHVVRRLLTDTEIEAAALEAKAIEDFRAVIHGAEATVTDDARTAVAAVTAAPAPLTIPEAPALKA